MSLDQAVAFALTGVDVGEGGGDWRDRLAALGWTTARIAQHVRQCREENVPWPHAVPAEARGGIGAAQVLAAVASVASEFSSPEVGMRSVGQVLTADERRLLAEVPPHHGT